MKVHAESELRAHKFANDLFEVATFAFFTALRYGVTGFSSRIDIGSSRKHVVINLYSTAVNTEHKLFCLVKCVMGCHIPSYTSSNIYTVSH
jgi:hypothetical protein